MRGKTKMPILRLVPPVFFLAQMEHFPISGEVILHLGTWFIDQLRNKAHAALNSIPSISRGWEQVRENHSAPHSRSQCPLIIQLLCICYVLIMHSWGLLRTFEQTPNMLCHSSWGKAKYCCDAMVLQLIFSNVVVPVHTYVCRCYLLSDLKVYDPLQHLPFLNGCHLVHHHWVHICIKYVNHH